jgi:CheY-like chemotaxis protein
VATAADGAAALSALDAVRPDAILLDLRMPVMDGYAFLTAYRTRPEPRAAVIVCSTSPRSTAVTGQGVAAYLRKPFDIDDLVTLIHRLAAARRKTASDRIVDSSVRSTQSLSGGE